MFRFTKIPVTIEAFQMTRERRADNSDWPSWLNDAWLKENNEGGAVFPVDYPRSDGKDQLAIHTLEGVMSVDWGDFIIQGVKGELYPCKPDIFAATYKPAGNCDFGTALDLLRQGERMARAGWNGKGMFVYLVPPASYPVQTGAAKAFFGEGAMVPYAAYLALKGVDDTVSTWAPSCSDALATDWQIVE